MAKLKKQTNRSEYEPVLFTLRVPPVLAKQIERDAKRNKIKKSTQAVRTLAEAYNVDPDSFRQHGRPKTKKTKGSKA